MPHHYYRDIVLELRQDVYEPREDSEMLAGVVDAEVKRRGKPTFLDLGCGSGLIAIVAAKAGARVKAVDINEAAVELTKRNAELNGVNVDCFVSNLLDGMKMKFDIIAFNAPYLPESVVKGENEKWAAGANLQIIRQVIEQASARLNPEGVLLLVVSSLTGMGMVKKILESNGFRWETAAEKKVPWEMLYVLKAVL